MLIVAENHYLAYIDIKHYFSMIILPPLQSPNLIAAQRYQVTHPKASLSDAFIAGITYAKEHMTVTVTADDLLHGKRIAHVRPQPIKELR